MQGIRNSDQIFYLYFRKRNVDSLIKNVDIMAESPHHFVYQVVEKIDETKEILEEIEPDERSKQEEKFIDFIKGRLYNNGSDRISVIDAVVPGKHQICILNEHVDLDDWRGWFVRVTKIFLILCRNVTSWKCFI